MPVQAFVDDSGGKGHTRHFALVGLIADSEAWILFADEWRAELAGPPALPIFKMKDAAGLSGRFHGWSIEDRNEKLRRLAQIINRYARIVTYSIIDLDAHAKTWALRSKPQRDPYFFPFHNTILASAWALWDFGVREKFEIIFDEHLIFGHRAKLWYPFYRKMLQIKEPEMSIILPVEPIFRSDDEFLPLQAADMFAWCGRNEADAMKSETYEWLLNEMPNLMHTEYSQYYDLERMQDVIRSSEEMAMAGHVPRELLQLWRDTAALMKKR